jgi:hypothetical protein
LIEGGEAGDVVGNLSDFSDVTIADDKASFALDGGHRHNTNRVEDTDVDVDVVTLVEERTAPNPAQNAGHRGTNTFVGTHLQ